MELLFNNTNAAINLGFSRVFFPSTSEEYLLTPWRAPNRNVVSGKSVSPLHFFLASIINIIRSVRFASETTNNVNMEKQATFESPSDMVVCECAGLDVEQKNKKTISKNENVRLS